MPWKIRRKDATNERSKDEYREAYLTIFNTRKHLWCSVHQTIWPLKVVVSRWPELLKSGSELYVEFEAAAKQITRWYSGRHAQARPERKQQLWGTRVIARLRSDKSSDDFEGKAGFRAGGSKQQG